MDVISHYVQDNRNKGFMAAKMYIFECARSRSRLVIESFCNYMNTIYLQQQYVAKLEFSIVSS